VDNDRRVSVELGLRGLQLGERISAFGVGERPSREAELDHVAGWVAQVDRGTEAVIDFDHLVAVLLPACAMTVEGLTGRGVEGNVVDPARQASGRIDVHLIVAEGFVLDFPERDQIAIGIVTILNVGVRGVEKVFGAPVVFGVGPTWTLTNSKPITSV
jgi:hypothetical protein